MMIRHKHGLLSKKNHDLIYFSNTRFAANMETLMEAGNIFLNEEHVNGLIMMTPFELNKLLDEARYQGENQ